MISVFKRAFQKYPTLGLFQCYNFRRNCILSAFNFQEDFAHQNIWFFLYISSNLLVVDVFMSLVFPKASLERSNEAQGASSEYILPFTYYGLCTYLGMLCSNAPNLLIRQENPYLSYLLHVLDLSKITYMVCVKIFQEKLG